MLIRSVVQSIAVITLRLRGSLDPLHKKSEYGALLFLRFTTCLLGIAAVAAVVLDSFG